MRISPYRTNPFWDGTFSRPGGNLDFEGFGSFMFALTPKMYRNSSPFSSWCAGIKGGFGNGEKEKGDTKTRFDQVDRAVDVETFNCAGLALRTYQDLNPDKFIPFLEANNKEGPADEGDIKFYFWEYNYVISDDKDNVFQKPSYDFHIISAPLGSDGNEMDNFYSKNGQRPVYGPTKSSNWIPTIKERVTESNKYERPGFYMNKELYWHLFNIQQRMFIIPVNKIPTKF